jgi:hypothetical protein
MPTAGPKPEDRLVDLFLTVYDDCSCHEHFRFVQAVHYPRKTPIRREHGPADSSALGDCSLVKWCSDVTTSD